MTGTYKIKSYNGNLGNFLQSLGMKPEECEGLIRFESLYAMIYVEETKGHGIK